MIHADVPPPAPEENTKAEQYVVRVARFIRNRYIQHGLAGEFTVGRTLGVSTKALLVKVRESDIADGVDDDEAVDDAGGDIGPSKKEQQSAGRALTALVSSSLAEMMRNALETPPWADLVRTFSLAVNPFGFKIGVGVEIMLRANQHTLAAAERRRLAALPAPTPPTAGAAGGAAASAGGGEEEKPAASAGWRPGSLLKKLSGNPDPAP